MRGRRPLRCTSSILPALPAFHNGVTRRIGVMNVEIERRGGVTTLTLNRPEAMNAVDKDLGNELREAVQYAARDDETRAVVLTGNGRAFCSGADLKAGFDPDDDGLPAIRQALDERFHPIIEGLRTMPK